MKTDSIFYRLFQVFPSSFFELIGAASQTSMYEFASVELKQTAFRIDGLFLPAARSDQPIYFVEVQFQNDPKLYARLFAEIFLYFRLYDSIQPWYAVVLFAQCSLEPTQTTPYQVLLNSAQVQRIYLDEVAETTNQPLGIKLIQLIVEAESRTLEQARQLLEQSQQELADPLIKREIIELIETIVLYKFPRMSREEFAKMFEVNDLRQTRFYQEVAEEARQEGIQQGKLEAGIPLLQHGFSIEEIAEILNLDVAQVRQFVQQQEQ